MNSPDAAITRGHGPVRRGWAGLAIGVRMEITDHLSTTRSRCPMRIDKGLWIDLEMCFRQGVDIGCLARFPNAITCSQQDAAAFARMRVRRCLNQRGQNIPCHLQSHRHVR